MSVTLKKVRITKLEIEGFQGIGLAIKVHFLPMYTPKGGKDDALNPFGFPIPIDSGDSRWWSEETAKKLSDFVNAAEKDLQKHVLGEEEQKATVPDKVFVMPEGEVITGLGNVPAQSLPLYPELEGRVVGEE
jgi:hypothetical protein